MATSLLMVGLCASASWAQIRNLRTGQIIPGTEGITPGPFVDLAGLNLTHADLSTLNLTGANLSGATLTASSMNDAVLTNAKLAVADLTDAYLISMDLTNADLSGANLTNARVYATTLTDVDLSGAVVVDTQFDDVTSHGFTKDQLYSTASYQQRNLQGIKFAVNDLTGWDFRGQDLTNARLYASMLTDADLTGAVLVGTQLDQATSYGFTKEQLYSTASYQLRNLQRIQLANNDLFAWDFGGQDLKDTGFRHSILVGANFSATNLTSAQLLEANLSAANMAGANLTDANLSWATLTNTNLTGAMVAGADFSFTKLTPEQLYLTASYQGRDLQRINLGRNNLTGWNFAGQDLTGAELTSATLTRADLAGAIVSGTTFDDARGFTQKQLYSTASFQRGNLQGIGLSGYDLSVWDRHAQDLTNAQLAKATLAGTNLAGANLTDADLHASTATGASLSGANLTSAVLEYATLTGANLRGANLTSANMGLSILDEADLTGAVVMGASFSKTTSSGGFTREQLYSTASYRAKNLQGIDLSNNDLSAWDFSGQVLTGADLSSTRLANTDFTGANLIGANFAVTRVSAARFDSADLRGATWFGKTFVNDTVSSANLIRPDGVIRGLELGSGDTLVVRDHQLAISVENAMVVADGAKLEMRLEDATWGSTMRVTGGVNPDLGGTLALRLVADARAREMVGVAFPIFDWNEQLAAGESFRRIESQPGVTWDTKELYTTGNVRLTGVAQLMPGDANRDLKFDQLDLVQVLQASKYLTGLSTTWGEGDWNGGPGGWWASPPAGDGVFDQLDIVAALQGGVYLGGPYAALAPGGQVHDAQTSVVYYAGTGEVALEAPNTGLSSVSIQSETGMFTRDLLRCVNGLVAFNEGRCDQHEIFASRSRSPFHSRSFGTIAEPGLARDFILEDLSVTGSLPAGGGLGDVDLIYAAGGILPGGSLDDDSLSLVYYAETGELAVDLPRSRDLGVLQVTSNASIFVGERPDILGLSFDAFTSDLLFLFRQASGVKKSFSFGTIVEPGFTEEFLLHDLTALARPFTDVPRTFGPVDLIYVPIPEPSSALLLVVGVATVWFRDALRWIRLPVRVRRREALRI